MAPPLTPARPELEMVLLGAERIRRATRLRLRRRPPPVPILAALLERFLAGDPKYVSRLAELWRDAPPIKVKMRWSYRIVWQVPGFDVMRFQGFLSSANEPDGYMFYDWIPADATTWDQLGHLNASQP